MLFRINISMYVLADGESAAWSWILMTEWDGFADEGLPVQQINFPSCLFAAAFKFKRNIACYLILWSDPPTIGLIVSPHVDRAKSIEGLNSWNERTKHWRNTEKYDKFAVIQYRKWFRWFLLRPLWAVFRPRSSVLLRQLTADAVVVLLLIPINELPSMKWNADPEDEKNNFIFSTIRNYL